MCPAAGSRRDIHNEHVKIEKGCKMSLETSKVRMSLRNEHFQNAARGPLKYVGPGPSAPHSENVHFEKKDRERRPTEKTFTLRMNGLHWHSVKKFPGNFLTE